MSNRIIGFDHRKSVLRHIPSANQCPDNIVINVNHEKSSSRAVYEYFTNKHQDMKTSNVSKNLNSFVHFTSLASHSTIVEIERCLDSI